MMICFLVNAPIRSLLRFFFLLLWNRTIPRACQGPPVKSCLLSGMMGVGDERPWPHATQAGQWSGYPSLLFKR